MENIHINHISSTDAMNFIVVSNDTRTRSSRSASLRSNSTPTQPSPAIAAFVEAVVLSPPLVQTSRWAGFTTTSMDPDKYAGMDPDELRNLGEYDTVAFRTVSAAGSSAVAGTILGAITATWQDVPAVERNVALPALRKTGRIMGNYGLTFGAIGGLFAFAEAVSASVRGKKDVWNSAIGGAAAGSILGLRAGKLPVGLGAAAALAACAVIVDAGGQTVRTPTGREYLPYPRTNPDL